MVPSVGEVIYDPLGHRRITTSDNLFKTCVIDVSADMCKFYRSQVFKNMNIILEPPSRIPHISVVKNEDIDILYFNKWKNKNRYIVPFKYSVQIETTKNLKYNRYWMLPCECEEASKIRRELGLKTIQFHITFGIQKFKSIEEKVNGGINF